MLNEYMNDIVTHKSKIGANDYNEPIFDIKDISCRLVDKFKQISNDKGEIVVSSGVIQCVEHIKVGDYINDRKVISVNPMKSIDKVIGYRGYLL